MTLTIPAPDTRARFLMIGFGLCLMFWMSLENRSVFVVSVLGIGVTLLYGGMLLSSRLHGRQLLLRVWFTAIVGVGAIAGIFSVLMTVALMFFKSSWHGHLYPDFPPELMLAMLTRLPSWTLGGALLGFSVSVYLLLRKSQLSSSDISNI